MDKFTAASIFTDNMILQRNAKVCIFGTANEGAEIKVKFNKQECSAICVNGIWRAYLDEEKEGGPYELHIICNDKVIILNNILVGDVYLAAGQSNMEFMLKDAQGGLEEIKKCDNNNIRFYNVPQIDYENKEIVIPDVKNEKWNIISSENAGVCSAIAYFFAKRLEKDLKVPIGIIGCNKGGTSASCWMREEYLCKDEEIKAIYVDRYKDAIKDLTEEQEDAETAEFYKIQEEYFKKLEDYKNSHPGISLEDLKEAVGHTPWPPPLGRKAFFRPYGLYYTMLKKNNTFYS